MRTNHFSYFSLNHIYSMVSQPVHRPEYVEFSVFFDMLQQYVYSYQRTGSTDTSTVKN